MLKNLKMRTKLIGGFILVALIAAVVGITGIVNIHKVAKADRGLFQDSLVPLPVLADLRVGLQTVRVAARDDLAARTPEQMQKFESQISTEISSFDKTLAAFDANNMDPEEKKVWAEFRDGKKAYFDSIQKVIGTM